MRHILLSLVVCIVCASCASQREAFSQSDITITPPIKVTKRDELLDGGTTQLQIIDAAGKQFDIYCYRGHLIDPPELQSSHAAEVIFYLNAYPGRPGSVRVGNQEEFKKKILQGIRY
jgi:hypothetical protein